MRVFRFWPSGTSVPVECTIEERSANAAANVVTVSEDVKGKVSPIEFFTVSDRLFYRRLEIDLRVQPHVSRGLDGRRRQPWAVRHVILVEARDDVGVRGVVDVNSDLRARPAVSEDLCHAEIEVVAAGAIERGRGIRLTVTFPDERLRPS